jgi:2-polyprenyl-3-methyl-5-hydroxy-6-metoxy-1,4-benzoquinol methylase
VELAPAADDRDPHPVSAAAVSLKDYYERKALEVDELAATYASAIPYKRFFYGARAAKVLELLDPGPGETIVDVGCGSGYYTRVAAEAGARVVAVDVARNYVEQARAHVGDALADRCAFRVEDAERLSLRDGAVDKVLMTEVIEHVPDPGPALREATRVLRRGGRLVVSTPSRFSPLNVAYAAKRRVRRYGFNEHLHELTPREFRALVGQDLELERLEFVNFLLPYPLDLVGARLGERGLVRLAATERVLARLPIVRALGWTMVAAARKP